MIKLKKLLTEQNDDNVIPQQTTGKLIEGITNSDPWQYYLHYDNDKWYTKRRENTKWLDMQARLLSRYGSSKGAERYELAVSRLQKFIDDEKLAAANKLKVVDIHVDEHTLQKIEIVKTIPTDSEIEIDKVFGKDIKVPIEDVEFDDKWIEVSAKRNPTVEILAKTPQMDYLRVILPKRGLFRKNVETWVAMSDFDVTEQNGKYIGTYNYRSGNRYEIYKPKQRDKIDTEK